MKKIVLVLAISSFATPVLAYDQKTPVRYPLPKPEANPFKNPCERLYDKIKAWKGYYDPRQTINSRTNDSTNRDSINDLCPLTPQERYQAAAYYSAAGLCKAAAEVIKCSCKKPPYTAIGHGGSTFCSEIAQQCQATAQEIIQQP